MEACSLANRVSFRYEICITLFYHCHIIIVLLHREVKRLEYILGLIVQSIDECPDLNVAIFLFVAALNRVNIAVSAPATLPVSQS